MNNQNIQEFALATIYTTERNGIDNAIVSEKVGTKKNHVNFQKDFHRCLPFFVVSANNRGNTKLFANV